MQYSGIHSNEEIVAAAFSKQSVVFDDLYASNTIIRYKRERVRGHLQQFLQPGSKILELNSGTGDDAIWLAQQGHTVHATDISEGMLQRLSGKLKALELQGKITAEKCSFTQLEKLANQGPYDLLFSNFAGLNCSDRLDQILHSCSLLLKPDGRITAVILPGFCLWETLLILKGKFRTAFRRFAGRKGAKARMEGEIFRCWYYHPSYVIKCLSREYEVLSIEGLCSIVPPSYVEHFAEKYPRLFQWLKKKEDRFKKTWPWKNIGDYYIITMQKKEIAETANKEGQADFS